MDRPTRSIFRGAGVIAFALVIIAAIWFAPRPKPKGHPPNNDPWKLVSYSPDTQYGTYLGNGFISTRIMGDGVGSQDGKPLPCFMAGLYDNEKLIPIPTWSDLRFYDGKTQFKIDKDAPYKQTLDMQTSILTTEATWRAGSKTLKGKIEVIVSRAEPNVGLVRAEMTPDFDGIVRADALIRSVPDQLMIASLSPDPSWPGSLLAASTKLNRTTVVVARRIESGSVTRRYRGCSISESTELDAKRGIRLALSSYSAVATAPESAFTSAVQSALAAVKTAAGQKGALISAHTAAWAKLWQHDIIIDGPKRDQQAIHSCMFYLLQSVREGSQWSIPPMGLSDNAFSGHVFWDADVWMFPALILQHPELARSIVDYRYNTLPGAIANAKAAGYQGADYAWESGYTGKEDIQPGLVYRNERHINGDVALAQWQYYLATNDLDWLRTRGYPVIKATADYWANRAKLNPAKGQYEILQVVPPDENAELVNNSVYTNAIAKTSLDIAVRAALLTGASSDPKWSQVASKLYIPFDASAKRFIGFDDYAKYRGKPKQADAELLAYPLQFRLGSQSMTDIYRNTYTYCDSRVDKNGPAMTSSAHAIIAARLGDPVKAYSEFLGSYEPFLRGPMNYFNEKRSQVYTNMCFLTGAAGPIQSTLFGLAGARMDYFPPNPSTADLQFAPCLPKQWKSLKITGVQWHGKTFDVTITRGNKVSFAPHL